MHELWIRAIRYSSVGALAVALTGAAGAASQVLATPAVPRPEVYLEKSLAHLEAPSQLSLAPPPWREQLEEALNPERVPAAEAWPTWLAHRRPGIVYHVPPPPPARVREHGELELEASAGRGEVSLAWQAPDLEGLELTGYRVERLSGGGWVELAELGFEATSWSERVAGDGALRYRLTSTVQTDDHTELDPELATRSAEVSVSGLLTWAVVPRKQLNLADGRVGVQLELYRWTGERFVRSLHTVRQGAPIGDSGLVLAEVEPRDGTLAVRVGVADGSTGPGLDPQRWWSDADRPRGSR